MFGDIIRHPRVCHARTADTITHNHGCLPPHSSPTSHNRRRPEQTKPFTTVLQCCMQTNHATRQTLFGGNSVCSKCDPTVVWHVQTGRTPTSHSVVSVARAVMSPNVHGPPQQQPTSQTHAVRRPQTDEPRHQNNETSTTISDSIRHPRTANTQQTHVFTNPWHSK